ncbi:uncharacterized protein LOC116848912 [Odontomachus brunneus]|uniref:uncharacterized protein LOC116848912 n=1 Tax=Odontomachus brunneus TaxID=486640 RepID=UPI0013F2A0CD|nr:uncharacterized protein LOC116848912 [Odontomachus brunneus]
MRVIFAILVISGLVAVRSGDETDWYPLLRKCKRNQTLLHLQPCIEDSIRSLQYYLKNNKILFSRYEPYYEEEYYMFNKMKHFDGFLSLYNIQIKGLTDYTIKNRWIAPDFCQIKFDALFSNLQMEAMYYMKANIMGMNITTSPSRNRMSAELTRNKIVVILEGEFYQKHHANNDVKEHFRVRSVEVNLDIGWNDYFFDKIDRVRNVSININKHLKQNWWNVKSEVIDQLQQSIATRIESIANSIYKANSMKILMPYD